MLACSTNQRCKPSLAHARELQNKTPKKQAPRRQWCAGRRGGHTLKGRPREGAGHYRTPDGVVRHHQGPDTMQGADVEQNTSGKHMSNPWRLTVPAAIGPHVPHFHSQYPNHIQQIARLRARVWVIEATRVVRCMANNNNSNSNNNNNNNNSQTRTDTYADMHRHKRQGISHQKHTDMRRTPRTHIKIRPLLNEAYRVALTPGPSELRGRWEWCPQGCWPPSLACCSRHKRGPQHA